MTMLRRKFMQSAIAFGVTASAIGAGLLAPQRALAAYIKAAFAAKDVNSALMAATGKDVHTASDQVKLKAPDIAENGAVVPITVSSTLPNVDSITIIASANESPLTSTYMIPAGTEPFISTRIKMGETSDVIAVVRSDGALFSATKEVKVTIGGCGG